MKKAILLIALASAATAALAQSVALSGMLGGKALIIVDGGAPKSVAPGASYQGVKIVSTLGDQAVIEIGGRRHTMRVGDAPARVGDSSAAENAGGNKIVLTAGTGGHFLAQGQINGRAAQLLVDTGATLVSMSANDADRMGLAYKSGEPIRMSTANGVTPGWKMKLISVRVGDVTAHEVDAVVSMGAMPYILLGNSFLSRFQMTRTNDQMVLEKRY
ncbi:TIGR02281 family clan AA aspartic protease [Rhodoferax sp. PAMC 29310]|uniref:retropepsin-like aspartic protease family protein n=1 Tax=Rhodoferax sp. PAMC 29310 TaxID=2822760 RepID=UPI001F0B1E62|nr:TIGR02281 family clan AA aspartic protease [Rhodoferax sp. PAMC 29310]